MSYIETPFVNVLSAGKANMAHVRADGVTVADAKTHVSNHYNVNGNIWDTLFGSNNPIYTDTGYEDFRSPESMIASGKTLTGESVDLLSSDIAMKVILKMENALKISTNAYNLFRNKYNTEFNKQQDMNAVMQEIYANNFKITDDLSLYELQVRDSSSLTGQGFAFEDNHILFTSRLGLLDYGKNEPINNYFSSIIREDRSLLYYATEFAVEMLQNSLLQENSENWTIDMKSPLSAGFFVVKNQTDPTKINNIRIYCSYVMNNPLEPGKQIAISSGVNLFDSKEMANFREGLSSTEFQTYLNNLCLSLNGDSSQGFTEENNESVWEYGKIQDFDSLKCISSINAPYWAGKTIPECTLDGSTLDIPSTMYYIITNVNIDYIQLDNNQIIISTIALGSYKLVCILKILIINNVVLIQRKDARIDTTFPIQNIKSDTIITGELQIENVKGNKLLQVDPVTNSISLIGKLGINQELHEIDGMVDIDNLSNRTMKNFIDKFIPLIYDTIKNMEGFSITVDPYASSNSTMLSNSSTATYIPLKLYNSPEPTTFKLSREERFLRLQSRLELPLVMYKLTREYKKLFYLENSIIDQNASQASLRDAIYNQKDHEAKWALMGRIVDLTSGVMLDEVNMKSVVKFGLDETSDLHDPNDTGANSLGEKVSTCATLGGMLPSAEDMEDSLAENQVKLNNTITERNLQSDYLEIVVEDINIRATSLNKSDVYDTYINAQVQYIFASKIYYLAWGVYLYNINILYSDKPTSSSFGPNFGPPELISIRQPWLSKSYTRLHINTYAKDIKKLKNGIARNYSSREWNINLEIDYKYKIEHHIVFNTFESPGIHIGSLIHAPLDTDAWHILYTGVVIDEIIKQSIKYYRIRYTGWLKDREMDIGTIRDIKFDEVRLQGLGSAMNYADHKLDQITPLSETFNVHDLFNNSFLVAIFTSSTASINVHHNLRLYLDDKTQMLTETINGNTKNRTINSERTVKLFTNYRIYSRNQLINAKREVNSKERKIINDLVPNINTNVPTIDELIEAQHNLDSAQVDYDNENYLLTAYNKIDGWNLSHGGAHADGSIPGDHHKTWNSDGSGGRYISWMTNMRNNSPPSNPVYGDHMSIWGNVFWNYAPYQLNQYPAAHQSFFASTNALQTAVVNDKNQILQASIDKFESYNDEMQNYIGLQHWDADTHIRWSSIFANLYKLHNKYPNESYDIPSAIIMPVNDKHNYVTSILYAKITLNKSKEEYPTVAISGRFLNADEFTRDISYRSILLKIIDSLTTACQLITYVRILCEKHGVTRMMAELIQEDTIFNDRFGELLLIDIDDLTNQKVVQNEQYSHWNTLQFANISIPDVNLNLKTKNDEILSIFINKYGFNPTNTEVTLQNNVYVIPYTYNNKWEIIIMRFFKKDNIVYRISCTISVNNYLTPSILARGDSTFTGDLIVKTTNNRNMFQVNTLEQNIATTYPVGIGTDHPKTMLHIHDTSMSDVTEWIRAISKRIVHINTVSNRTNQSTLINYMNYTIYSNLSDKLETTLYYTLNQSDEQRYALVDIGTSDITIEHTAILSRSKYGVISGNNGLYKLTDYILTNIMCKYIVLQTTDKNQTITDSITIEIYDTSDKQVNINSVSMHVTKTHSQNSEIVAGNIGGGYVQWELSDATQLSYIKINPYVPGYQLILIQASTIPISEGANIPMWSIDNLVSINKQSCVIIDSRDTNVVSTEFITSPPTCTYFINNNTLQANFKRNMIKDITSLNTLPLTNVDIMNRFQLYEVTPLLNESNIVKTWGINNENHVFYNNNPNSDTFNKISSNRLMSAISVSAKGDLVVGVDTNNKVCYINNIDDEWTELHSKTMSQVSISANGNTIVGIENSDNHYVWYCKNINNIWTDWVQQKTTYDEEDMDELSSTYGMKIRKTSYKEFTHVSINGNGSTIIGLESNGYAWYSNDVKNNWISWEMIMSKTFKYITINAMNMVIGIDTDNKAGYYNNVFDENKVWLELPDQIFTQVNISADGSKIWGIDTTEKNINNITYQWLRNGSNISSATGSTYLLSDDDKHKEISVIASYSHIGKIMSDFLTSVPNFDWQLYLNTYDDLSNTVHIYNELTATQHFLEYGYKEGRRPGSTWLLSDDKNTEISIIAYHSHIGKIMSGTSDKTTLISPNIGSEGTVSIIGTAIVGQILVASANITTNTSPLTYQWKSNDTDISGATESTYTVQSIDLTKTISVVVSYDDESVTSNDTVNITNINNGDPGTVQIIGTAKIGNTLNAYYNISDPVMYRNSLTGDFAKKNVSFVYISTVDSPYSVTNIDRNSNWTSHDLQIYNTKNNDQKIINIMGDETYMIKLNNNANNIQILYNQQSQQWLDNSFQTILDNELDNDNASIIKDHIIPAFETVMDETLLYDGSIFTTIHEDIGGLIFSVNKVMVINDQYYAIGSNLNLNKFNINIETNPNIQTLCARINDTIRYMNYKRVEQNVLITQNTSLGLENMKKYVNNLANSYNDITTIYEYKKISSNPNTYSMNGISISSIQNDINKQMHTAFIDEYAKTYINLTNDTFEFVTCNSNNNDYFVSFYKEKDIIKAFFVNMTKDYMKPSVSIHGDMAISGKMSVDNGIMLGDKLLHVKDGTLRWGDSIVNLVPS
jgi:hypothetical protein